MSEAEPLTAEEWLRNLLAKSHPDSWLPLKEVVRVLDAERTRAESFKRTNESAQETIDRQYRLIENIERERDEAIARAEKAEADSDMLAKEINDHTLAIIETENKLRAERDEARADNERLRAENERLRAVLTELVALKDLKERIEAINPSRVIDSATEVDAAYEQRRVLLREYNARKPLAWQAAREALADRPDPLPNPPDVPEARDVPEA